MAKPFYISARHSSSEAQTNGRIFTGTKAGRRDRLSQNKVSSASWRPDGAQVVSLMGAAKGVSTFVESAARPPSLQGE